MTDALSPTTQFHPYRKPDATPVAERPRGGFASALARAGADPDRLRAALERGRSWARLHPGPLLGALAIGVVAAGLIRGRVARPPAAAP